MAAVHHPTASDKSGVPYRISGIQSSAARPHLISNKKLYQNHLIRARLGSLGQECDIKH